MGQVTPPPGGGWGGAGHGGGGDICPNPSPSVRDCSALQTHGPTQCIAVPLLPIPPSSQSGGNHGRSRPTTRSTATMTSSAHLLWRLPMHSLLRLRWGPVVMPEALLRFAAVAGGGLTMHEPRAVPSAWLGQGRDALEGGEVPPSRAPGLRPATVPLRPSASLNGICNRQ